jgi:DNA-binding transcriptional ArsR family regulator
MFKYERDYGQKNGETNTEPNMEDPPVIPRINSELFCERKKLGICHRSAAFCHHRRDFGVADACSRRRNQQDALGWHRAGTRFGREKFSLQIQVPDLIVNQMVKYSSTLNRTFAALADPTRRRILAHLARGDRRVTDLARPHAMSLPAVSKHLRVLEKAGLLRRRRYGRVHEMQLDAKPLKQAAQWVEEYRKFWEASLDRLADYLEKTSAAAKKGKT